MKTATINKTERLEKIIAIATKKANKELEDATPKSNYEEIQRTLNKDFKAIQWYASQRNDMRNNENYQTYSINIMDTMDEIYEKINPGDTQ